MNNPSGSTEDHIPVIPPQRSPRNKHKSPIRGGEGIIGHAQMQSNRRTTLGDDDFTLDPPDRPAGHNPSISLGKRYTDNDIKIRNKLFDIICKELREFEDKNLNEVFIASEMKEKIQAFYRNVASGRETTELDVSIANDILEIIRNDAVPWGDMKSMKIAEAVPKIYSGAGWIFLELQTYPPREQSSTPTFSGSLYEANPNFLVSPQPPKRRSDYTPSMSTASSFSKRLKVSSYKYNCYYSHCDAHPPDPKEIGRHSKTHNPYEFTACIVPGCPLISLRKDVVENHCLKVHKAYMESLSEEELKGLRKRIRRNTFIIKDRTHDHCVFCDKTLPRGTWEDCRKSHVHILDHLRDMATTPLVFRHSCSNKDECGTKDYWRTSLSVQPENRERVPASSDDGTDTRAYSQIDDSNEGFSENRDNTEQQETPNTSLSQQQASDYDYNGSSQSFDNANFLTYFNQPFYKSPYSNKENSTSQLNPNILESSVNPEPHISMLRYRDANPDSEFLNNYTIRNPAETPKKHGTLKSTLDRYVEIIDQSHQGVDNGGTPSSL